MFPQSTVLDPLFWMAFGALQVLVFAGANQWAKQYQLGMNWWKWALVGGWWASIILTVAGAFTLLGENEVWLAGTSSALLARVLLSVAQFCCACWSH